MQRTIKKGHAADAGLIRHIFIQDSTSTTGAGKTGLIFSDFTVRYIRNGGTLSGAITAQDIAVLGTYAAPTLNTNIRIKEVDATNAPGLYEVQLHSGWVATGADVLSIRFAATGAANTWLAMPLDAFDPQDTMRLGLTALPNAAAAAAGGLPVSNAGGLDLDAKLAATNEVTAARMAALTDWIDGGRLDLLLDAILDDTGTSGVVVAAGSKTGYSLSASQTFSLTGNINGNLSGSVGTVSGSVGSISGVTFPTNFSALGITIGGAISNVVLVATTAANTDMRGTNGALLAADYTAPDNAGIGNAASSASSAASSASAIQTILAGITSLGQWLGLIAGKQVGNATALAEINATGAGSGTYDPATDSHEAIRDTAPLGTAMRGTDGANTTTPPTSIEIADALLDRANGIETGVTPRQSLRIVGALLGGKISGAGSGSEVFLGMDGATTRVTVTVDPDGNRTAIVYNI